MNRRALFLHCPSILRSGFSIVVASLLVAACSSTFAEAKRALAGSSGEAPRDGAADRGNWASGVKEIFGTAYESYDRDLKYSAQSSTAPLSKVWFSGSQGLLSELYWPTLDTAQTRDTEILISDGKSFLWGERLNPDVKITWLQKGVPAYHVLHQDTQKRFVLEKWIFSDPDRDTVVMKIRLTRLVPGLQVYVLHKPAVHNTPMGDSARVDTLKSSAGPNQKALVAWEQDQAQALISSCGFVKASAAFVGPYDGYADLGQNFKLDSEYQVASNGNVTLIGQFDIPESSGVSDFDLAIAFAGTTDHAVQTASQTLSEGAAKQLDKFVQQWPVYLAQLKDLSADALDGGELFWSSVALIKSMEDKTYEGAFVAAPSIPWGTHRQDWADAFNGNRASQTGGYHLVWPRDLYQMATTMMAVNDFKGARAALNRLRAVQFGPKSGTWEFGERSRLRNGSFPQNFWMNGDPYWDSLQLDEVSMPIVLAYRLWKAEQISLPDYWDMISRAADFVADFGPWSAQERWEEIFGVSPSTVAAEISALWTAAEMADAQGDASRSRRYRELADHWSAKPGDNIEAWTFTNSGALGDGHYFERLEGASYFGQLWNPNDELEYSGANGTGLKKEKNIVDGGFLELVRFGVREATSPSILASLPEYDASIRSDVPGMGPGFKRYIGDLYNQDESTGQGRPGMLWPLLSGERGHFELELARVRGGDARQVRQAALPYLAAIEHFATPTHMIPEQVWDMGAGRGQPTGAATPLGWAHGEYIKFLRSLHDKKVFDRLDVVEERSRSLR